MAANPLAPLDNPNTEPTRAEDLVSVLSERLAVTASAKNVYGEPITAHNRTLVPVAKVRYGVGASSGGRNGQSVGGGAGGGGVAARPAGYIEITDERTRYVSFSMTKKIIATAVAGIAAGYLLGRFGRQINRSFVSREVSIPRQSRGL